MDQGECVCKLARRAFWQVSILWFLSYFEHKRMLCSSSCTFLAATLESATSPRKPFFSSHSVRGWFSELKMWVPLVLRELGTLWIESHMCAPAHVCVRVHAHSREITQTPPIPLHTMGFVLISTLSVLVTQPSQQERRKLRPSILKIFTYFLNPKILRGSFRVSNQNDCEKYSH